MKIPPILDQKFYNRSTVFRPENLLREARRQKGISELTIPEICILDPDGDIVEFVVKNHNGQLNKAWACYHTDLIEFTYGTIRFGIIGKAVGASFAVLLAEQLFASGCKFLLSMTSAGQLVQTTNPPYFVLIEKAVRDEGTSYHYIPESEFSFLSPQLLENFDGSFDKLDLKVIKGATWTTDAPYRETEEAINYYRKIGIHAVEMEASALYAFATYGNRAIVCFAHVTNQMAVSVGDFEKGESNGSRDALDVLVRAAECFKKLSNRVN